MTDLAEPDGESVVFDLPAGRLAVRVKAAAASVMQPKRERLARPPRANMK